MSLAASIMHQGKNDRVSCAGEGIRTCAMVANCWSESPRKPRKCSDELSSLGPALEFGRDEVR